jgi:undecaprenyl phosphate-alpha-L-ara4N flippase subunit ArnF
MRDLLSGFRNPWVQLALSIVCVFVSELLLKLGAAATANPSNPWSWTGINGLTSPIIWLAILFVLLSFLSWLYVLRHMPLSIAFPPSRVVDVLVPLGSWIFLGEHISTRRWCGIALVILGLAIIARPAAQLEERL